MDTSRAIFNPERPGVAVAACDGVRRLAFVPVRVEVNKDGLAVEDGDDHNRLSTYTTAESGRYPGYDVGWFAPCKSKNIDKEITADVAPLALALYRKSR